MWVELVLFLFLAVCAVFDGLYKQIPLIVVWLGMLAAVAMRVCGVMGEDAVGAGGVFAAAVSLIPGAGFLMLSLISKEKVGYGDGWVLLMIGLFLGIYRCFLILLAGLFAESLAAVVLLMMKKIQRDREIPFLPFLLLGMGVVVCF